MSDGKPNATEEDQESLQARLATRIKVTFEMEAAGEAAYRQWAKTDRTRSQWVWIYRAMEHACRKDDPKRRNDELMAPTKSPIS